MAAKDRLSPNQFQAVPRGVDYEGDADDGPYCSNCSDDIDEVMEWNGADRQALHPNMRAACRGCGAV
jgi:hypothetical protein